MSPSVRPTQQFKPTTSDANAAGSFSTLELLEKVLSQPTAPFREGWVSSELARLLKQNKIPHCFDQAGNLIAGVYRVDELHEGFRIGLMAHMDHPGFHLDRKLRGRIYQARWYGGAPWKNMLGARLRLFDPQDRQKQSPGQIVKINPPQTTHDDGLAFSIEFDQDVKGFSPASFGTFDFPGFELSEDFVRTRAADDLAGCTIALGALIDQEVERRAQGKKAETSPRRLIGIFTRAEEVGFIGCLHLLKKRILPPEMWLVSLEASRALPEAEAGKGPVLRIGDACCLFDPEVSAQLWSVAKELTENTLRSLHPFRYQRRLMSGGMCEGTPLTLYGYQVSGIAVPLLNYHNIGVQGPAPEIISANDVDAARRLCVALGQKFAHKPDWRGETKREILSYYKQFEPLLKPKIHFDESPEAT